MLSEQITTKPAIQSNRWQPSHLDELDVSAALDEANVAPDDLYHNAARRNFWQIEVNGGCAKEIVRTLENARGFWTVTGVQDFTGDDEPLALVSFHYETPEEFDPYFWADRNED